MSEFTEFIVATIGWIACIGMVIWLFPLFLGLCLGFLIGNIGGIFFHIIGFIVIIIGIAFQMIWSCKLGVIK